MLESCPPISYHLGSDMVILQSVNALFKPIKSPTETFKSERNNEVGELIDSYSVYFTFLEAC